MCFNTHGVHKIVWETKETIGLFRIPSFILLDATNSDTCSVGHSLPIGKGEK